MPCEYCNKGIAWDFYEAHTVGLFIILSYSFFCRIESLPRRTQSNAKGVTVSKVCKSNRNCILSFFRRMSSEASHPTTTLTAPGTVNVTQITSCQFCEKRMSSDGIAYHQVRTSLLLLIHIYIFFSYS
jgi:hypothetical protein